MLLAIVPFALAESQRSRAPAPSRRCRSNNGDNKVVVKLKGMDKPCEAHYFKVVIFWGKKKAYQADAGCYGVKWIPSLYYQPNRNSGQGGEEVKCEKFNVAYDKDKGTYKVVVPRKCMDEAPDKIKVRAEATTTARRCRARRVRLERWRAAERQDEPRADLAHVGQRAGEDVRGAGGAGQRPDRVRALHDQPDAVPGWNVKSCGRNSTARPPTRPGAGSALSRPSR